MATETVPAAGRRHAAGVGAIAVLAAAVYSAYALVRFRTFRTTTYDLVIFDQAVRSYSRFHLPVAIVKGVHNGFGPHFTVLGDHFSPILAVLAPLYWIHDGPETLLVAQSVLLAVAVVPLWAFARRRLGVGGAYCAAGVYALSWPVAETVAFDFHELAFAPVLSALMLERDDAGRRWQCAAAAGALLMVKEDMGLLVAGFGGYLLTRRGRRRRAAVFVVGGLAWTWFASRVLIPAFGGSANYYWAYGALGRDLPQAAGHALTHPLEVLRLLVTPHVKATTMLWLVAPLLLLPLASPITLAVLPPLAERMLSSKFGNWWEPRFHYNVALVALLVAAGADGAARLGRLSRLAAARRAGARTGGRTGEAEPGESSGPGTTAGTPAAPRADDGTPAPPRGAAAPVARGGRTAGRHPWYAPERGWAAAALAVTVAVVPRFAFGRFFDAAFYRRDAQARAAAAAVAAVPSGVLVEAANIAGPRLSARDRVLLWDTRPRWAPWVVADVGRRTFPFPSLGTQRDRVCFLRAHGYTVVFHRSGYLVLHRPDAAPDLRASR